MLDALLGLGLVILMLRIAERLPERAAARIASTPMQRDKP